MTPFNIRVATLVTGHRLVLLAAAVVPVLLAAPAGAQLNEALQAQAQVDKEGAGTQKDLNNIRDRTQDAAGRFAQATADAESLERYNNQLNSQVKTQETEIASIERQLLEIETTNREVQPLMQQMVDTLDQFVKLDVPFFLDERTARVQRLKDMMARADVTISEKYRLILEAYQIELDYGRTLDAYQGRLGAGADARTVEFVRLGRVSLMYRTLDGSETGYWDATQKKWVADSSYKDDIQQALRVARGQGAKELLIVPVPAPKEMGRG
jgi:flagellar motility protein MotE (MotC chaperone)